jgi:AraC family transcriptional regulator of adaptative response / DNA-3-methyladenine glycosylase II
MSMTGVALAAGFGSVRRFNEIFQDLFHRPPSALRRRVSRERCGCGCSCDAPAPLSSSL